MPKKMRVGFAGRDRFCFENTVAPALLEIGIPQADLIVDLENNVARLLEQEPDVLILTPDVMFDIGQAPKTTTCIRIPFDHTDVTNADAENAMRRALITAVALGFWSREGNHLPDDVRNMW